MNDPREDGVLTEVFRVGTGKAPVVATAAIIEEFGTEELIDIWREHVVWWKTIRPTLPAQEQIFVTEKHGKKVWVIVGYQAFTILFPEEQ